MELALPDLSQVSRIYSGDDQLLAEPTMAASASRPG